MSRVAESYAGKKVAVVGLGKSNRALCRYLLKEGAKVTCFDKKNRRELGETYTELDDLGADWSLGPGYLTRLPDFQWIFLTPGIKKSLPEITLAKERGAVISGEVALFLDRCKAKVCGITGSAGKTTTTTLVGMMLKASLPETPVYVGGNIGSVLIEDVDSIPPEALVVLELSSFQLELMSKSPDVALFLNVQPNHLDVHDSYEDYVSAKTRIFQFQNENAWCVLNYDDPTTRQCAHACPGNVGYFSTESCFGPEPNTIRGWLQGDELKLSLPGFLGCGQGEAVTMATRRDLLVPGKHNVKNALAAAMATILMGGNLDGARQALRCFKGIEHRIELVREVNGVKYYNDSIATSPDRTQAFLEAVEGPVALILGGYDKGIPFQNLARKIVGRGDVSVVTLGVCAPLIENALQEALAESSKTGKAPKLQMTRAETLEEAVRTAASMASPGWSVALSPACASYDMFTSFEERGRLFKQIVGRILSPQEVNDLLTPCYPGVKSRLLETSRGNPLDTLVATILSQATNDNLSTKAFANLKHQFADWESVLDADREKVEEALKPGGLYREKTNSVKAALGKLREDFGSVTLDPLAQKSPKDIFKYLTSLKGVGPKTAACVLAFGFGLPAFPVDTHVLRITRKLGIVPKSASASSAQDTLENITPDDIKMSLHLMLIEHGRQVCSARKPKCAKCVLRHKCTQPSDEPDTP